jgi:hypothetical protein
VNLLGDVNTGVSGKEIAVSPIFSKEDNQSLR